MKYPSQTYQIIKDIFETIALHPLRVLYKSGPNVTIFGAEIGFWDGASLEDICSRLTTGKGIESIEFWKNNMDQCKQVFERKERAFLLVIGTLLYFIFLFRFLSFFGKEIRAFLFG
eukprot:c14259_g1_i1.p1 GENE.c14259_g1_i1~~c14259_g1_i1.p1  ORF type:complete len:116 (+),score=34.35 c14259_g1_i1:434-781(+)